MAIAIIMIAVLSFGTFAILYGIEALQTRNKLEILPPDMAHEACSVAFLNGCITTVYGATWFLLDWAGCGWPAILGGFLPFCWIVPPLVDTFIVSVDPLKITIALDRVTKTLRYYAQGWGFKLPWQKPSRYKDMSLVTENYASTITCPTKRGGEVEVKISWQGCPPVGDPKRLLNYVRMKHEEKADGGEPTEVIKVAIEGLVANLIAAEIFETESAKVPEKIKEWMRILSLGIAGTEPVRVERDKDGKFAGVVAANPSHETQIEEDFGIDISNLSFSMRYTEATQKARDAQDKAQRQMDMAKEFKILFPDMPDEARMRAILIMSGDIKPTADEQIIKIEGGQNMDSGLIAAWLAGQIRSNRPKGK